MLPLESGRAELLEEIMTTVAPDRQTEATPNPTPRRNRWLAPVAAAAVVAGLAGGTLWWQQQRPEQDDSSRVAALGLPEGQAVVLDAPGWKVDSLGGDGIQFRKGDANLEVTSYAAKDYDSYVEDREYIVDPPAPGAPVTVLGRPGQLWAYSPDDHTVIREVEDGRWLEFRGQGMDQDAYLALLGQLRLTSDAEFDAALPDDYVTKDERDVAAEQILGEIRGVSNAGFPDGSSLQLGAGESKDYYQFGAEVVGAVHLRLARGLRERQGPRPAGTCGRGGASPRHVSPVADPEADECRRRLLRGGLGARRPGRRRSGPGLVPRGAGLLGALGAQLLDPVEQLRLLLVGERHRELVQVVAQLGDLDLAMLCRLARPPHRDGAVGERDVGAVDVLGQHQQVPEVAGRERARVVVAGDQVRRLDLQLVVGVHQLPLLVAPPAQLPRTHVARPDLPQPVGPAAEVVGGAVHQWQRPEQAHPEARVGEQPLAIQVDHDDAVGPGGGLRRTPPGRGAG